MGKRVDMDVLWRAREKKDAARGKRRWGRRRGDRPGDSLGVGGSSGSGSGSAGKVGAAGASFSEETPDSKAAGRTGVVKRFANFFERDIRGDEDLRSMKRRIVQVRRQPDHAAVRCQMGFRSRTGWEPIRAVKENQDCLVALVPWGPDSQYALFAALDGHGRNGHICAMFVAQRVISYLSRALQPEGGDDHIANCMRRAIDYAESKLESPKVTVDYALSGSTGVFVLLHHSRMYCANVGDSRAVIGRKAVSEKLRVNVPREHETDSFGTPHYVPIAVSVDQKPSREDEKARLLGAGARVDAWVGMELGEERVWLPNQRLPGLAVSRSFGDLIVKDYGVITTPEVYCLDLWEDDRFLVMASDGVFEFLSSVEVVAIVSRFRDKETAQQAAEELVRIATERWIADDSVIDDISCVVVYLDVASSNARGAGEPVLLQTTAGESRFKPGVSSTNLATAAAATEGRDVDEPSQLGSGLTADLRQVYSSSEAESQVQAQFQSDVDWEPLMPNTLGAAEAADGASLGYFPGKFMSPNVSPHEAREYAALRAISASDTRVSAEPTESGAVDPSENCAVGPTEASILLADRRHGLSISSDSVETAHTRGLDELPPALLREYTAPDVRPLETEGRVPELPPEMHREYIGGVQDVIPHDL